jgi:hypothetical protein
VNDVTPTRPTVAARVVALPVRGWRVFSTRMPSHCRFYPSCSAYAPRRDPGHAPGGPPAQPMPPVEPRRRRPGSRTATAPWIERTFSELGLTPG